MEKTTILLRNIFEGSRRFSEYLERFSKGMVKLQDLNILASFSEAVLILPIYLKTKFSHYFLGIFMKSLYMWTFFTKKLIFMVMFSKIPRFLFYFEGYNFVKSVSN